MSRMLGVLWRGPVGAHLVQELAWALRHAAASDPLFRSISGPGKHCDGFGFFMAYEPERGAPGILMGRSDAYDVIKDPEFSCAANLEGLTGMIKFLAPLIRNSRKGLLLLHVRSASPGEPRGTPHAHPFLQAAPGREGPRLVVVAHEGWLDKSHLAADLGLQDPTLYSDSYLLTHWLTRRLNDTTNMKELLDSLRDYTMGGSAMNILIAALETARGRGFDVTLHVYSYIPENTMQDSRKARYYAPILFRGEGVVGFFSSTLEDIVYEIGLDVQTSVPTKDEVLKGFYTTLKV